MQPDLINMFQRLQGHSKEVVGVFKEGSNDGVGVAQISLVSWNACDSEELYMHDVVM